MPTPDPSPSTVLGYAAHVSANSDTGLVVLLVCGLLLMVSLGVLLVRSIA